MCAAIHPGEILREEYMAPLGLSANALAVILPQKYWQIRLTRGHLCEELKKSPCPGEDRGGVLFRRTMGVEILPNEEA